MHKALLFDIAQYEFSVGKASALIDTNVRQVAEYDHMQQSVEAEMCVPTSPDRLARVQWRWRVCR